MVGKKRIDTFAYYRDAHNDVKDDERVIAFGIAETLESFKKSINKVVHCRYQLNKWRCDQYEKERLKTIAHVNELIKHSNELATYKGPLADIKDELKREDDIGTLRERNARRKFRDALKKCKWSANMTLVIAFNVHDQLTPENDLKHFAFITK